MKHGLHKLPRNQAAINALASQWISLQDEFQADSVGAESDVLCILGQTGSSPKRQASKTKGYKSWSHGMTNVSILDVNMLKNSSTLATVRYSGKQGGRNLSLISGTSMIDKRGNEYYASK